jgi:stringent starvation protein B
MVDNGLTPHLVVDAHREGVHVPPAHVENGKIVLNVSPAATRALSLGNELVTFEARFGGVAQQLSIPIAAVQGIYARETGQGMLFGDEESPPPDPGGTPPSGPAATEKPRPKLKVIK